jgi:hypothetical protein
MEKKTIINAVGVLDKNEEGEYIVTVENKDGIETYILEDILKECEGQIISISCAKDIF